MKQADQIWQAAESARAGEEKAMQAARAAGAEREAPEPWGEALASARAAQEAHDRAEFEAASKAWKTAAQLFQSSESRARSVQAYRKAKADYNGERSSCDAALLDQYGGADWTSAQEAARLGERNADQPDEGRKNYEGALASLKKAWAEAEKKAAPTLVI